MSRDSEKLVPFDRGRRPPDPARVAEFAATARKLQQEREGAATLVARLLSETPYAEWPRLAEREELRNSGALEKLGQESVARLHKHALEAVAIADLATKIAEALPDDTYPAIVMAQLRAHAIKDRGRALWYLARYRESLADLDQAEQILDPFGTLAHDRAIVRLVRASALQDIQRFDEALALLAESKKIFDDHGDRRRHLICGIAEGAVLHHMGRYRDSREVWNDLLPVANALGDEESVATLHNNIGHASVELSEYDTAETHLKRAIHLFQKLDLPLQIANVELARGRMLVRRGYIEDGIRHLGTTRDQFLRHGLVEEAGLCGLDIVEAFLVQDMAAPAEQLARRIVNEFTAAQLNTRAIIALGYLSETIAARRASAATAANVRQYIYSLRKEPDRAFVATA
jgi:tetratricopeptide (TPR) repeat protein